MKKLIKDGRVAVLVSSGYGAGWSTWGSDEMLFDPRIAQALLDALPEDELQDLANSLYPEECTLGVDGLYVRWIPVGKRFRVEEYDGAESLRLEDDYDWMVA